MDQTLKKAIIEYLDSHRHASLATVTEDGGAHVSTVSYVNQGLDVYFMTDPSSRKAKNIPSSNRIALAVTEDYLDWDEIRGVHLSGTVEWIAASGNASDLQEAIVSAIVEAMFDAVGYPGRYSLERVAPAGFDDDSEEYSTTPRTVGEGILPYARL